jgi:hypothetical protein
VRPFSTPWHARGSDADVGCQWKQFEWRREHQAGGKAPEDIKVPRDLMRGRELEDKGDGRAPVRERVASGEKKMKVGHGRYMCVGWSPEQAETVVVATESSTEERL